MSDPATPSQPSAHRWSWLVLLFVLMIVVFIRIRLAPMPLERDEGEYALAGQFILQGKVPSDFVYTMKLPGVALSYAGIMALLGQSATGIHLGLLVVNMASAVLVLAIARKWLHGPAPFISAAMFAVMSLSPHILGLAAHATHFVVLFVLAGCWVQVRKDGAPTPRDLFLSGILIGVAVLMKQAALPFIAFGILLNLTKEDWKNPKGWLRTSGRLLLFSLGAMAPYLMVSGWVSLSGNFRTFWFWTTQYASEYASRYTILEGFQILRSNLSGTIGSTFPLWLLGLTGLAVLGEECRTPSFRLRLLGLLGTSFLAVCPGFYFRQHYFIVMLPALALLGGCAIEVLSRELGSLDRTKPKSWITAGITFSILGYPLWVERDLLFRCTPMKVCRQIYGANPFPESPAIAKYLENHAKPTASIAVVGSEPQISFLSHRQPATGYIYTYGLMEPQPFARRMQEEMIHEIETAQPQYLVFAKIQTSWLMGPTSDKTIITWCQKYVNDHFEMVGLIDIYSAERTEYHWDQELIGYSPKSQNLILVYKRKTKEGK